MAMKCIERYVKKGNYGIGQRNFLLGGRNNKGEFQLNIYQHTNSFTPVKKDVFIPQSGQFHFQSSVPNIKEEITQLINRHIRQTMPWDNHPVLVGHMKDLVKDISNIDNTVGGKIIEYTIM